MKNGNIAIVITSFFFYQIWFTFYKQLVNNIKMKNNTQKDYNTRTEPYTLFISDKVINMKKRKNKR